MKLKLLAALALLPLTAPALAQQPVAATARFAPAASAQPPKLIVAISVDQFATDLFQEYRQHFTGGLKRLSQGVAFPNGFQGHAATETCPGHSTILTGSRPARTGIVGNGWFDLGLGREDKAVYCSEDPRVEGSASDRYTVSPYFLRVPTLGDLMRRQMPGSRSVAIAGKDRAAVMMGGHNPDQRWWWGRDSFVSHAGVAPTAAVSAVNTNVAAALSRAQPALPLPTICQSKARGIQVEGGGRVVGDGRFAREPGDRTRFRASPEADGAVLALAAALRGEMRLGEGPATDLLAIGLSASDYVGHTYGTQGSEMCIQLIELDRSLGAFFDMLDQTGVDYLVMLTADHGGHDIPERHRQHAVTEAQRVDPALDAAAMDQQLRERFGIAKRVLYAEYAGGDVYVARDLPPAQRRQVRDAAVAAYRAHPQVEAVLTREEIAATASPSGPPDEWTLLQRARASFDPERSGDFLVLLKPRVTPIHDTSRGYVATHGSVWDYDRKVPILFWRRGLTPFEQTLSVETADILPTIGAIIGLQIPGGSIDGRCLDVLEGPASSCPPR